MKRIIAHCGIGYRGAVHDEEFEFPDDTTEEKIFEIVNEWAQQYVEVWWEEA